MEHLIAQLEKALTLPNFDVAQAHKKMTRFGRGRQRPRTKRGAPRVAAVLCLLYPNEIDAHIVLTKRPDKLRSHSGQVSFPGGSLDEGETLQETALRETCEEIGVPSCAITIVGKLTDIYIPPSDFEVHPFVGVIENRPKYIPNPAEVEVILEPTISHLLNPATIKTFRRKFDQWSLPVNIPYFDVEGHVVWGATAIMLSEFLERWKRSELEIGELEIRDW